jgi:hypothetical protein
MNTLVVDDFLTSNVIDKFECINVLFCFVFSFSDADVTRKFVCAFVSERSTFDVDRSMTNEYQTEIDLFLSRTNRSCLVLCR